MGNTLQFYFKSFRGCSHMVVLFFLALTVTTVTYSNKPNSHIFCHNLAHTLNRAPCDYQTKPGIFHQIRPYKVLKQVLKLIEH